MNQADTFVEIRAGRIEAGEALQQDDLIHLACVEGSITFFADESAAYLLPCGTMLAADDVHDARDYLGAAARARALVDDCRLGGAEGDPDDAGKHFDEAGRDELCAICCDEACVCGNSYDCEHDTDQRHGWSPL